MTLGRLAGAVLPVGCISFPEPFHFDLRGFGGLRGWLPRWGRDFASIAFWGIFPFYCARGALADLMGLREAVGGLMGGGDLVAGPRESEGLVKISAKMWLTVGLSSASSQEARRRPPSETHNTHTR